ncbi:MAG: hypothetical protein IAI50_20560 [Candidatus Eremiobacteraeota bacterium]|nr:hypothetical protein [Candidatus Eremiobacteraeota bacterium]
MRALRQKTLVSIYNLAKKRDAAALLAEESKPSPSPSTPDPAIALALFTVDRSLYARRFVSSYPSDRDALSFDYGDAFARAHVEPGGAAFPIKALGSLAIGGDPLAFEKLVAAVPVTDGSLGRAYRDELQHVIVAAGPARTLHAFADVPIGARLGAVAAIDWCRRSPAALLAFRPTPRPDASPSASPADASASPKASATASGSASPGVTSSASPSASSTATPRDLSLQEVAALQAAISNAARIDCTIAHASGARPHRTSGRARKANPKKPAQGSHTH